MLFFLVTVQKSSLNKREEQMTQSTQKGFQDIHTSTTCGKITKCSITVSRNLISVRFLVVADRSHVA